jgi:hypothetical protein
MTNTCRSTAAFFVVRRERFERHAEREAEYGVTSRDDVGDVEK